MANVFEDAQTFVTEAGLDKVLASNKQLLNIVYSEVNELEAALADNDWIETMDAIIDSIVTLATLGVRFGFTADQLSAAWDEVQRSNMSKTIAPEVIDGKLQKGPHFVAPNLADIVFRG